MNQRFGSILLAMALTTINYLSNAVAAPIPKDCGAGYSSQFGVTIEQNEFGNHYFYDADHEGGEYPNICYKGADRYSGEETVYPGRGALACVVDHVGYDDEYFNCKLVDYRCWYYQYYDSSLGYCKPCPVGRAATVRVPPNYWDMWHQNTSCSYCDVGYYKSGGACIPCPGGGTTKYYGDNQITSCYITPHSGEDVTGYYDVTDNCHYSN